MGDGLWQANPAWDKEWILLPILGKLEAEVFYLHGEHDVLFKSPQIAEWVSRNRGRSNVIAFSHSGHSPQYEETDKFKNAIEKIYDGLAKQHRLA